MAPTCAGANLSGTPIAGANLSGTLAAGAGPNEFMRPSPSLCFPPPSPHATAAATWLMPATPCYACAACARRVCCDNCEAMGCTVL